MQYRFAAIYGLPCTICGNIRSTLYYITVAFNSLFISRSLDIMAFGIIFLLSQIILDLDVWFSFFLSLYSFWNNISWYFQVNFSNFPITYIFKRFKYYLSDFLFFSSRYSFRNNISWFFQAYFSNFPKSTNMYL